MFSKKKGTVIGTPGASSRNASSKIRQGFTRLSWKARIGLALFGSIAGLVTALALGFNPLSGIALLAAFALFVSGLFVAPAIWSVISVLALYSVVAIPFAGILVSRAAGGRVDLSVAIEASLSLMTAALLVSWFAMRFSRSAPWKSLALALVSASAVGFAVSFMVPSASFNAMFISMALVTAYRCGGKDLAEGAFTWVADKVRPGEEDEFFEEVSEVSPRESRVSAEKRTADALTEMNTDTLVFHDVVAGKSSAIAHVVISTTGVSIISSVVAKAHLTETAQRGLTIPGVDLSAQVAAILEQRNALAKTLKMRPEAIHLVIAVHGGGFILENVAKSFAVYSAESAKRKLTDIHVTSADEIMSVVDTGLDMWNPIERRAITRRARIKLTPAHLSKNLNEPSNEEEFLMALIDDDGRESSIALALNESESTAWMLPGTAVVIETSQGVVGDIIITGELARNENNELVVPVCAVEEWMASQEEERTPDIHWIKAAKIHKDNF